MHLMHYLKQEPPPRVIFILATTELQKIPSTVRSRCMIFHFKSIDK
jgi:DNA polymerase-3 subunit gamma/tau